MARPLTRALLRTLTADDSVRMTLSEAPSVKACEASRASVVRILAGLGKPPLLARRGQSDVQLTPFVHGTPPEAEVQRYQVTVHARGFGVTPLAATHACQPAPEATPAVYCTRSALKPRTPSPRIGRQGKHGKRYQLFNT
jgi:hypothetical protein